MAGRGRNQPFFPNMMPRPGNNGRPVAPLESNMTDARVIPVLGVNGRGQSGQFNFSQAPIIPLPRGFPQINGHIHSLDSQLQFQTLDSPITGSPNQEYDGNPESKSPHTHHISSTVVSSSIAQKSGTSSNMERSVVETLNIIFFYKYQLSWLLLYFKMQVGTVILVERQ